MLILLGAITSCNHMNFYIKPDTGYSKYIHHVGKSRTNNTTILLTAKQQKDYKLYLEFYQEHQKKDEEPDTLKHIVPQVLNASFPSLHTKEICKGLEDHGEVIPIPTPGPSHTAHCRITTKMIPLSEIKTEPMVITAIPQPIHN